MRSNPKLRLHLHILCAAALCPFGTSTWWSNSLIMLACHMNTKDEAMLTSSSEHSCGRLPHCTLNNVLYLIIESSISSFLITQAQAQTPHLRLSLLFSWSCNLLLGQWNDNTGHWCYNGATLILISLQGSNHTLLNVSSHFWCNCICDACTRTSIVAGVIAAVILSTQ